MDEEHMKEFECPICNNYMGKPIYQCLTGHSVCSKCKPKLESCPYCQQRYGNTRNYAMENLIERLKIKCKNQMCSEMVLLQNIATHMQNCLFKPSSCKGPNCKWSGLGLALDKHIKEDHKSLVVKNHSILVSHQLTSSIVECDNNMFWLKRHMDNGLMFWTCQSTCAIDAKQKFGVTIKIIKPDTPEFYSIQFPCVTDVLADEEKMKNANMISVHKNKTTGWKFQVSIEKVKKQAANKNVNTLNTTYLF